MWNISAASRASHSKASEVYDALTRTVPRQIAPEVVSIIREAGWFHEFKVDFRYPLDAGCIITALDLIFECFCVVLPYSLNRVSPNKSNMAIQTELRCGCHFPVLQRHLTIAWFFDSSCTLLEIKNG